MATFEEVLSRFRKDLQDYLERDGYNFIFELELLRRAWELDGQDLYIRTHQQLLQKLIREQLEAR